MPLAYFLVALPLLGLFGLLSHVARGAFNIYPDRGYSGSGDSRRFSQDYSLIDDMLSGNYSYTDYLVGTEYDENGYYDLYSVKNLRIACQFAIVPGIIVLLAVPEAQPLFRMAVDASCLWLWQLFLYRIETVSWF